MSNCYNEEQREVCRVEQPQERGIIDAAREWVSTRSRRISVVDGISRWTAQPLTPPRSLGCRVYSPLTPLEFSVFAGVDSLPDCIFPRHSILKPSAKLCSLLSILEVNTSLLVKLLDNGLETATQTLMECFAIFLRVRHCVSWVIAWSYSPLTPAQAGATRGRPCCDEGKASSVDLLVYWKRTQTRIGDKNHQSLKRGTPSLVYRAFTQQHEHSDSSAAKDNHQAQLQIQPASNSGSGSGLIFNRSVADFVR
nr:hypothetical protein Iba_chr03bCG4560 [Ipomoea batatas]